MSAPDTNIEKQTSRHRFVLVGLVAVALFAAAVFLANVGTAVDDDAAEPGPTVMSDG